MSDFIREFIELFNASGWSQSEVAKKIFKTRSAVSRFLSGQAAPSESTIQLFKLVLSQEKPGALDATRTTLLPTFPTELERWSKGFNPTPERVSQLREAGEYVVDYGAKLRQLPESQRRAVHHLIDVLVNSDLDVRAARLAQEAAAGLRHGAGSPRPGVPDVPPGEGSLHGSGLESAGEPAPKGHSDTVGIASGEGASEAGTFTVGRVKPGKSRRKK